ncbi:MAG: dehydrogenase subunit [Rickettsiaceae bacterium]|jgi:NADH-quinone oxidoreductase subunit J|nr:dehydrogenase subunit [Rickettsiaceae bacterium]
MFLILAFFNAAGLFVLLNAEFLAMLLVIVYVGAIAVLFLFVVMMLNIDDKQKTKRKYSKLFPFVFIISIILLVELFLIINSSSIASAQTSKAMAILPEISNTKAIGDVLYTKFIYQFQLSGMILFVAMIGAIVLTLRDQDRFIRKQDIAEQSSRNKSQSVEVKKVAVGEGIEI